MAEQTIINVAGAKVITQSVLRVFVEDPSRGWFVYPIEQTDAGYISQMRLQPFANQAVNVAVGRISLSQDGVLARLVVQFSDWKIDPHGQVDQEVLRQTLDQFEHPDAEVCVDASIDGKSLQVILDSFRLANPKPSRGD